MSLRATWRRLAHAQTPSYGHVRGARRFVYWRAEPLREAFETAGWRVDEQDSRLGHNGQSWLTIRASRHTA